MREFQVEHGNVREPPYLTRGKVLRGLPITQRNVVGKCFDAGAQEIMFPLFKRVNKGEHFAFVRGVILFSRVELARGAGNKSEMALVVFL